MSRQSSGEKEEQAYSYIKEAIQTYKIKPLEQISEQKISLEIGDISRTPIKDALRRLICEGLVVKTSRGLVASKISLQDLIELSEVRAWIERGTVRLFVERAGDDSISEIKELLKKHRDAYENGDCILADEYDSAFHLAIARGGYNMYAYGVLNDIVEKYTRGTYLLKDNMPLIKRSIEDHEMILSAIMERDAEKASENMVTHLKKCIDYLKNVKMTNYYLFKD